MPVKRTTGTGQLVYSLCWGGEDVVKEDVLRSPRMLPFHHHYVNRIHGSLCTSRPFVSWFSTTAGVRGAHKRLVEEDQKSDLKLAPHLKAAYIELNNFYKTSVSSAVAVLNRSVGAAMLVFVKMELLPVEAVTTGVLELLTVYNFKFVLLCRLTQDDLRNLFSCVRARSPVPRALEFKLTPRLFLLSQFSRPSCKGSYQIDDIVDLLEFLEVKMAASEKSLEAGEEVLFEDTFLDDETPPLDNVEMESLVYLSGYITRSVRKRYTLCNACKAYLKDEPIEEHDELLQCKSYRAQSQPHPFVRPSA
ncbi:hypothetical protein HPB48_016298 [Haemaphysalis longicornis]|uniref:Uncharacterized protein n=1 Tax=Haemaphysalis longicornis TaxID=44386 RepID=A0A9J6GGE5_HAELO|nr:hypothetical protein HPB48_016298 [Haemaphysalis longicornis]